MKRILLTAGDSFSYDFEESADDPGLVSDFEKWPAILAKKMDCQVINKSKINASNICIYDHLIENIIKYHDRIDLVVAGWTFGLKTSIFRNYELNFISLKDQDVGDLDSGDQDLSGLAMCMTREDVLVDVATKLENKLRTNDLLFSSIEQSLRLMVYLQEFCDSKNIKCIHYPLCNIFKTRYEKMKHLEFLEEMTKNEYFQKIQNYNNVIGWPCDGNLGGYTYATAYPEFIVSEKDHHPNAEGQKMLAQEVYDKYLEL